MHNFHHKQSSIIFKLRSRSIDCKANRKSAATDLNCRLCMQAEETQYHVINCPKVCDGSTVELTKVYDTVISSGDEDVVEICRRVDEFNKLLNSTDDE